VDTAVVLLDEVTQLYEETLGVDHAWTAGARVALGYALAQQGGLTEAEYHLHQALEMLEAVDPESTTTNVQQHRTTASLGLGLVHLRRGRYAEAEPLLMASYAALRDGVNTLRTTQAQQYLNELQEATSAPDDQIASTRTP